MRGYCSVSHRRKCVLDNGVYGTEQIRKADLPSSVTSIRREQSRRTGNRGRRRSVRRREFMALFGGAVAGWPMVARAQQSRTPQLAAGAMPRMKLSFADGFC
jgi:hypothetical protein